MKHEIISNSKSNISYLSLLAAMLMILFAGFVFGGCSNTANPLNPNGGGSNSDETNLSFSTMLGEGITDDPTGTLVITEAKALITEVDVEISSTNKSWHREMFVINFDVSGSLRTALTSRMPKGTFNKIKFNVHKPEDNQTPPDPEFKTGNSGNQRFSFIVKGTYNGTPFVYKSRKSMNIVLNFQTATNIASGNSNLTMIVDKMKWFTVNGVIVDPMSSTYEDEIEDNIKSSFKKIFRDDDKNGIPDDNSGN